ncbi:hypothetical protein CJJ19_06210 [Candidatus Williamhamiltonella defendens]|nr:glycosyltransferase [Candidatus Hamiltonella defensa]AYB49151.1 hypothetical protein CJJ19_06210 [Candidatus Hamiltonella defensa]
MKIKYSIIIPCYNSSRFINNTLQKISFILSSRNDVEIIFVDDGSTDDTYEKLLSFSFKKKLIICKKNEGVSSARNEGIFNASGDYILFLDSDDFYSYNIFDKLDTVAQGIDLIFFGYDTVDIKNKRIRSYLSKFNNNSKALSDSNSHLFLSNFFYKKIYLHIGATVIKRKFLQSNSIFFDKSLSYCEDIDFLIRAISLTNSIVYIRDILFHYVNRTDSTVHQPVNMSHLKRIDIFEKFHYLFSNNYSIDLVKKFNFFHLTLYIHLILGAIKKGAETEDVYDKVVNEKFFLKKRKIKFPNTILGLKCYIFYKILSLIPIRMHKNLILFFHAIIK